MRGHRPWGSAGEYARNWREHPGSTREKLRLAARNYWRRARHLDLCCGHPGEPGC